MKLLALTTMVLLFMSGLALAAPAHGERAIDEERINYSPEVALATLEVVEGEVRKNYTDPGMYGFYQDGDDLVLRKRPGRAKYGDITLKKGYRCGINDCDDGNGDVKPETRLNKAELVEAIASKSGLSKADSKKALDAFADSEAKALKKGDEVKLVGLGSFYSEYCPNLKGAKQMAKKTACGTPSDYLDADSDGDGIDDGTREGNPQTGKEIKIPAKNVVRGNGASGEMTIGEELRVNLPNGRRIIREVGGKK